VSLKASQKLVAFMGFDPAIVSKFDEKKITILIANPRIRIPEAKIRGAIEIQFRGE
jgi:3-methyladenine DNA glycosylase Tag